MISRSRSLGLLGIAAFALASCGNDNKATAPTPPVVTPTVKVEAQFGSCFATRFEADPYSKATDPVPCPDLAPLNLSAKPANI